jgi:hypothetical protein
MLAAVLAASLSLPAGLPPDLQIDGDLAEWTSRPVTIEQFHQVAGARRVVGEEDFSARVWMAFTEEGLAVAGEVRDDHVLFPTGEKDRLSADHVELWLAFPEAQISAFQFKVCKPPQGNGYVPWAVCQAWMKDQDSYQAYLHHLFVRQYSFSPLGAVEHFQGAAPKASELPFDSKPQLADVKTVFRTTADGYAFEAFVPAGALPASARTRLTSFSALVDFVDNDEGTARQEAFLSSSPRRRFGDRSTFQTVKLEASVRYASRLSLADRRLAGRPERFFFPAAGIDAVYEMVDAGGPEIFWNGLPRFHLPRVGRLPLAGQVLTEWNGFSFEALSVGVWQAESYLVPRYELATVRDGAIAASRELSVGCRYDDPPGPVLKTISWERPPGLHVALFCMSPQSSAGHGPCASCPVTEAEVVSVSRTGKIDRMFSGHWEDGAGETVVVLGADFAGTVFPANRDRFRSIAPGDRDEPVTWDEEKPVKFRFPSRFDFGLFYWGHYEKAWLADFITWSAAKKTYITVHREVPGAQR